jgi:hypothetical protein
MTPEHTMTDNNDALRLEVARLTADNMRLRERVGAALEMAKTNERLAIRWRSLYLGAQQMLAERADEAAKADS